MNDLDEKTLRNIYFFDDIITAILKKWFQLYKFKQPPQNETEKLTEIIRNTLINLIDKDADFFLDDYCKSAVYYARFYVHSLVLLSKGYQTVEEFYDVESNINLSEDVPPQTVSKAAKILIQALDDYYFDVVEFINNGTLNPENFSYLVRFIVGDCTDIWEEETYKPEEIFLLFFQEKVYGFAKFMATYIAISNGEKLRVKGKATQTTEEKIMDWVFNRGI